MTERKPQLPILSIICKDSERRYQQNFPMYDELYKILEPLIRPYIEETVKNYNPSDEDFDMDAKIHIRIQ